MENFSFVQNDPSKASKFRILFILDNSFGETLKFKILNMEHGIINFNKYFSTFVVAINNFNFEKDSYRNAIKSDVTFFHIKA